MKNNKKDIGKWLNIATVGTMIPVATGVGFLIGYFLDRLFDTYPYLIFLFTLLGIAAGFKNIIEFVSKQNKDEKKHNKKD